MIKLPEEKFTIGSMLNMGWFVVGKGLSVTARGLNTADNLAAVAEAQSEAYLKTTLIELEAETDVAVAKANAKAAEVRAKLTASAKK